MSESGARICDRVLVVEDDPLLRWSIAEMLEAHGFLVRSAGSGHEALELSADVTLLLTDYQLPDTNGMQLAASVMRRHPDCRLLMMTAYGSPDLRERARELGVLRVLDKPFALDALVGVVEGALAATPAGA